MPGLGVFALLIAAAPMRPEHGTGQPAGWQAEVVRGREALDAVAPAWQALEAQAEGAVFFQSLAWAAAVFDFEAARGNAGFDPVIALLRRDGVPMGVLPLERVRKPGRRLLVPLGQGFAQYSEVLLAAGVEPGPAVAALIAAAAAAAPADAVSLFKVRADGPLARGLPREAVQTGPVEGAPYVDLSAFADFESYFHTIKPKTRKNMRNARNRLEREAPVTHHLASGVEEAQGVIERTIAGRAERLRDQGLTSRAFGDADFHAFCRRLAGRPGIELMALSLRHGGRPIAEQWGFVHSGRYYAYVASRDFSHSEESPGKLHLGEVIAACAERGLTGADFLVPAMPYKLTWATEVVPVADRAVPLTLKGRLMVRLWDQTLRPRLKAWMLAMPRGVRGLLLRLAGRG